jgi:hypothetical protein
LAILLIWSVLLGVVLGRFFKVWVLVPGCAFVFAAVLVRSAVVEHGLLRPLLEFAMLIASLQIGYVFGLPPARVLCSATSGGTGTGKAAQGAARHRRIILSLLRLLTNINS